MNTVLFRLITAGMLPALFAALFFTLEKRSSWQTKPYWLQQGIIGTTFGVLAILGTEFGIPLEGAIINVRSAAPLTAGLIFGWPAGVIAGVIGGVERWFATLWGMGSFTRLACTLATFLAGVISAVVRVCLLEDRRPNWFHGLAVGLVTEVLHMLLVFLSNANQVQHAFTVVQICALPMIISNSLSVMAAAWLVGVMSEKKLLPRGRLRRISQSFQRWLFICVAVAFLITSAFTNDFQTRLAAANTESILRQSVADVQEAILEASDTAMLNLTEEISRSLSEDAGGHELIQLARRHNVTEIHLIGPQGVITASTSPVYIGYDMASGAQSQEFLCLLSGTKTFVQSYQPIAANPAISRKYAGVARENGFLQVGYDAQRFQAEITEQVRYAAHNRHIGQQGFILICDSRGVIISDNGAHTGESISSLGHDERRPHPAGELLQANILDTDVFCLYEEAEGYYIMAVLPQSEAMFFRNAAVYILAFMEIVVFAAVFTYIYFLIRRLIVGNIHRFNHALHRISSGDLNVSVDVRSHAEFAALSDDINATVGTLRSLIDEAAARIDRELEMARQIQLSALPSVFPPYPNRTEFDIFASMHTAREVGGDFYDFYFVDDNTLVMTIADVSDKGVPAAMFMMQAKALLRNCTEAGMPLDEAFNLANRRLLEGNDANMFVTVWSAKLDVRTGFATVANAGHNPPVLCPAGQPCTFHRTRAGLVMAASARIRYRQTELQLNPGDVLFLYTDGVTEATNARQECYGEKRLLALMDALAGLEPEEICRRVKADVDAFVGDAPQFDDITMLALRYKGGGTVKETTLPASIDRLPEATAFVEDTLAEAECPPRVLAKINIAIDELFSNIARYAYPDGEGEVTLRLEVQPGRMTLSFEDSGAPYNPLTRPEPDVTAKLSDRPEGGLGVFLVKRIMDDARYEYAGDKNRLTVVKTW